MAGPNTPYFYRSGGGSSSAGSGGTGKNYITTYKASLGSGASNPGNGDIELGATTGFSKGTTGTLTNAIPTGSPTFGSGANANLSIATASSSQIAGIYSLDIISAAATTAGDMVSTDAFFIDAEDQAKVLSFKIAYKAQTNPTNGNWSGTSSNSYGVAAYDVTNSSWLPVAGNFNFTQSTGVGICSGTFQTNSTTASIRLMIYNATASAGAITLRTDDWSCGPQVSVNAPAIGDWIAYVPSILGSGGNPTKASSTTADQGYWRRVGDSMEVYYNYKHTSSTGTAAGTGNYCFTIPTGYTIDTAKLNSLTSGDGALYIVGEGTSYNGTKKTGYVWVNGAFTNTVSLTTGATGVALTPVSATYDNLNSAATINYTIHFTVPIVGWSSNSVQSSDTDTRVVAMNGFSSGQTIANGGGNVQLNMGTITNDTHGGVTVQTPGTYTVPVSGYYQIASFLDMTAGLTGAISLKFQVNAGSLVALGVAVSPGANQSFGGSYLVKVNAGDTIKLYCINSTATNPATVDQLLFSITRLSGPAVVAATESVSAKYTQSSAIGFTNTLADIVVPYATKVWDTHSFYGGTQALIPVSGKYRVSATMNLQAATLTATNVILPSIYQNGSILNYGPVTPTQVTGSWGTMGTMVTTDVSANAGDTIEVRFAHNRTGGGLTLSAVATNNNISIERIGN